MSNGPVGYIVLHPSNTNTVRVNTAHIECITGKGNATILFASGRSVVVNESADDVDALLNANLENTLNVTMKLSKDIANTFLSDD